MFVRLTMSNETKQITFLSLASRSLRIIIFVKKCFLVFFILKNVQDVSRSLDGPLLSRIRWWRSLQLVGLLLIVANISGTTNEAKDKSFDFVLFILRGALFLSPAAD